MIRAERAVEIRVREKERNIGQYISFRSNDDDWIVFGAFQTTTTVLKTR